MPIPRRGSAGQQFLNLLWATRLEAYIDERISQVYAIIGVIELQFHDVGMVGRAYQPGQLVKRAKAGRPDGFADVPGGRPSPGRAG